MNSTNATIPKGFPALVFRFNESPAYAITSTGLYLCGLVLCLAIFCFSCCVIKAKKRRFPKYSSVFMTLSFFSAMRVAGFAIRVALCYKSTTLALFLVDNALSTAASSLLLYSVQDFAKAWVDSTLKRIKYFTPRGVKIYRCNVLLLRFAIIFVSICGVGSLFFMLSDITVMFNTWKSPGYMTFLGISIFGFALLLAIQSVSVFVRVCLIAIHAKLHPENVHITRKQATVIILAPICMAFLLIVLWAKQVLLIVNFFKSITINQPFVFYLVSVLPELLVILCVIVSSPVILHKLKDHKKQKKTDDKELMPNEDILMTPVTPQAPALSLVATTPQPVN